MEEPTRKCARALGRTIQRARLAKGISQEEFAEDCRLDRSYVGQVERGEKNISLESILRITRGLGVQPSGFFSKAGY